MEETAPLLGTKFSHGAPPEPTAVARRDGITPEAPSHSDGSPAAANGDEAKLGTYDGVFVPTTLNVLSILMFLRFGFIIGQAGLLGSLLLLVASYAINLLTTLSVSAIATNGTVRGGGAYYMISRSLGPEFGGSIGIIFYVGQVLNAGLNVAGFADPLLANFGKESGNIWRVLPESYWSSFLYQTVLLVFCTGICLIGPALFARSSKLLFVILITATVSVPLSVVFKSAVYFEHLDAWYTGLSWRTLGENMFPLFTKGAAGSEINERENFRDLFGIFFPATAGILAGASMSGDLRTPSKSIPKGTLWGIGVTIALYFLVIISIAASSSRELLWVDVNVISDINVSPALVMFGEFATSIFSALMGIIGAAKLLQAVARDKIVPLIGVFGHGTGGDDNPLLAIGITYVLTQLTILLDVNQIAVFITMAFLMTFVVTNIACFLLDVASAPNFRPSFRYFSATTAGAGTLLCVAAMVGADGMAASLVFLLGVLIFIMIHLYSLPKPWGDVSQAIIYHQVRKYLLKLRQDHVKYWRPQILLLIDDPRSCWKLMQFCNSLKKGGLFILGHVIVAKDFSDDFPEISRQRSAWTKLRDLSQIKAFVQVGASPDIVWGVRNVYLGSGLGGMRPNITVVGFYDEFQRGQLNSEAVDVEELPTDMCRKEAHMTCQQWVQILEDLLTMGTNVAVAKGFMEMELPEKVPLFRFSASHVRRHHRNRRRKFIDLYPVQMSAKLVDQEGRTNGVSINFDTYTLILQLGMILHTVKAWVAEHDLRVIAFVEHVPEIERERSRITELLAMLRIPAQVLVFSLDEGNHVYDVIVKGTRDNTGIVARHLQTSRWWQRLLRARQNPVSLRGRKIADIVRPANSNQHSRYVVPGGGFSLRKRRTLSSLQQAGVSHSMQATRWRWGDFSTFYNSDTDDESEVDRPEQDGEGDGGSSSDSVDPNHSGYGDNFGDETPSFQNDTITARQLATEDAAARLDDEPYQTPTPSGSNTQSGCATTNTQPQESSPGSPPEPSTDKLRFNELPAKAQHIILNCLMRKVSADASVIFSTLPAPALGTHNTEKSSRDYHQLIDSLCEGLPPTLLIHSQSMTVTTAL